MVSIGTTLSPIGKKALLCGSGELGKEVAIELQRYGVEVVALDRYPDAPAMQVAHRSYVVSMLDGARLREIVETLRLPTSPYRFAATREEFAQAVGEIGFPCVVKPIMSSSGHGQSVVRSEEDIDCGWRNAQRGGRAGAGKVIVEGFVKFDYEITLLTVRHCGGTSFLEPIGHYQQDGDYRESWQPQPMTAAVRKQAEEIARRITDALGGRGLFGVELFVQGDRVIFSEVSPRPHDTGMVTMISQDLSEFALHVRAILGLPVPNIAFHGPSASRAVVVEGDSNRMEFANLENVLSEPDTQMRIFGKSEIDGRRRMAVLLARGKTVEEAREKTARAYAKLQINVFDRE